MIGKDAIRALAGTTLKMMALPIGVWDDLLGNRFKVLGWTRNTLNSLAQDIKGDQGCYEPPPVYERASAVETPVATAEEPASTAEPEPTERPANKEALAGKEIGEASLAIEGYDDLNVHKIVGRMKGLEIEAIQTILAYERANKKRKTVIDACNKMIREAEEED